MKKDRAREIVQDTMQSMLLSSVAPFFVDIDLEQYDREDRLRRSRPQYDERRLHHTTSRPIRKHVRKSRARG